jgi:hypothetical protein
MALTPKQLTALRLLRRYFYLRTAHFKGEFIRLGLLRKDDDSAVTRGVLGQLERKLGFIRRHEPKMVNENGHPAPIFVLTVKGAAALAQELNDCSMLLTVEPNFRDWMSLNHYCALSSLHLTIDQAVAAQDYVKLHALYFEHEVINPAAAGGQKYRLHTTVSTNPTVYCCADSAMEVEVKGYRRALVIEYETGADGNPARVAAKKAKGHHGLATKQLFTRFFPGARDMRVLCFCPYESWMHHLRRELKERPGAEYWLFCDTRSVKPETFLHGEIFFDVSRGPFPLIAPPSPGPGPREGR